MTFNTRAWILHNYRNKGKNILNDPQSFEVMDALVQELWSDRTVIAERLYSVHEIAQAFAIEASDIYNGIDRSTAKDTTAII